MTYGFCFCFRLIGFYGFSLVITPSLEVTQAAIFAEFVSWNAKFHSSLYFLLCFAADLLDTPPGIPLEKWLTLR